METDLPGLADLKVAKPCDFSSETIAGAAKLSMKACEITMSIAYRSRWLTHS